MEDNHTIAVADVMTVIVLAHEVAAGSVDAGAAVKLIMNTYSDGHWPIMILNMANALDFCVERGASYTNITWVEALARLLDLSQPAKFKDEEQT